MAVIRDNIIKMGGMNKMVEYIKEGKSAKEVAALMGYKTYRGFQQALARIYGTRFSDIYQETLGKPLLKARPLYPAHLIKKYVDCGIRVNRIAEMLGVNYDTVSRTFKGGYSQTIREYKAKHGI